MYWYRECIQVLVHAVSVCQCVIFNRAYAEEHRKTLATCQSLSLCIHLLLAKYDMWCTYHIQSDGPAKNIQWYHNDTSNTDMCSTHVNILLFYCVHVVSFNCKTKMSNICLSSLVQIRARLSQLPGLAVLGLGFQFFLRPKADKTVVKTAAPSADVKLFLNGTKLVRIEICFLNRHWTLEPENDHIQSYHIQKQ